VFPGVLPNQARPLIDALPCVRYCEADPTIATDGRTADQLGRPVTDHRVNKGGSSGGTSSSLLDRVRAQDRAAWTRLVALYGPLVYRWCRQDGLQSQDAEDVGQEVFAAVYRKVPELRRDRPRDTFRGWLRVIARNKVRDLVRHRRSDGQIGEGGTDAQLALLQVPAALENNLPPANDPSETAILAQRALELLRAEFTEEKWQIFHRVVALGQSPGEVAADLGVSVNTVYLTKSRCLRRLRDEFAGLIDVDDR
jgi:RNA polymerase sigma-70 factor, ECF subfamily